MRTPTREGFYEYSGPPVPQSAVERARTLRYGSGRLAHFGDTVDRRFSLREAPRAHGLGRPLPIDPATCACGGLFVMRSVSPGGALGWCDGCATALARVPAAHCTRCDVDFCGRCTARAGGSARARGGGEFQPRSLGLEARTGAIRSAGDRREGKSETPAATGAARGEGGSAIPSSGRRTGGFADVLRSSDSGFLSEMSGWGATAHSVVWAMPSLAPGSAGALRNGGGGAAVGDMVMVSEIADGDCSAESELVVVEGTSGGVGKRSVIRVCSLAGVHRAVDGGGYHSFSAAGIGHKVGTTGGVVGRKGQYERRAEGPAMAPCTIVATLQSGDAGADMAWVVFEKCGVAQVVDAGRVTAGRETPRNVWITKGGTTITAPGEWELFCASEGTARCPGGSGGARVMGRAPGDVDAGDWKQTRAMGARIGQDLRRQALAAGESSDGALSVVYAIFAEALLLRPQKGDIEGGGAGTRTTVGDVDAEKRVANVDGSAAGTSDELRDGLMGSDRSGGGTGADDDDSGEDESYAALLEREARSESSGSDERGDGGASDADGGGVAGSANKGRVARGVSPERSSVRGPRERAAAQGASGDRGRKMARDEGSASRNARTRGGKEALMKALLRAAPTATTQETVGGLMRAVAEGRYDGRVARAVHVAGGHGTLRSTTKTDKGVERASGARALARLCQDTRGEYGEITDSAAARFLDNMTGQFQCGGVDMARVMSRDEAIGSTDLVAALMFRTMGSGADGKLAVASGVLAFLQLIVDGTVAAQGGEAKGEAVETGPKGGLLGDDWHLGSVPSRHDSATLSPLRAGIVGHRAAALAGAMAAGTVGLAALGDMLDDAKAILSIVFGAGSPIPVAAGRQRAALQSLVYGDAGAFNGVGVAEAFNACVESLGGIVVAACIGNGGEPLIDGVDHEGINPIAREAMACEQARRRLERATRGSGGVGSESVDDEGVPVCEGHGPRRADVLGDNFGNYHNGGRKVALRPAHVVEVDEYQRAITAALVGREPAGIVRKAAKGETTTTPSGRKITTGLGCPFFTAGRCVAGTECTLSHGPFNGKAYVWPATGALAPFQELYGIHIGFHAAP